MILFWRIRYLDRPDREFKDRDLFLDTSTLDALLKASVELCHELSESRSSRDMLKYRHLFIERKLSMKEIELLCGDQGFQWVRVSHDYFEDDTGKEICRNDVARILSGSPDAIAIPLGATRYDIDYMLAAPAPVEIDKIAASERDLKVLGYFVRDLRELENSALRKEGPGHLTWSQGSEPRLSTAVSDEEIRSFVTIFRRLYMANEPANFCKVVNLFAELAGAKPLVNWVVGVAEEYEAELSGKPDFAPFNDRDQWTFSRKRLIDVFIYTQYAHQPNDDRARQFQQCLEQVGNNRQKLTWLFLTELTRASLQIINAGRVIARVYDRYCDYWNIRPDLLDSIANDTPGLGSLETNDNKRERHLLAKAGVLAVQLWKQDGCAEGSPATFLKQAVDLLKQTMS